jgi:hypothetical protein
LLCAAAVCLALAGCSLIGAESSAPSGQELLTEPLTGRKKAEEDKSLFGSLFRRETRPSKTPTDFLGMPRVDF